MKTIHQIITFLILFSSLWVKSQQVDWNQINSNNAFQISSAAVSEEKSSISSIAQIGNNNNTELQLNSKTNIIVQQLGDQNSIYFNNSFNAKESKSAITTKGNNNIVDVTGSNSISEGMHLNVKGENMRVFMRNY